jgi:hypothetical protein
MRYDGANLNVSYVVRLLLQQSLQRCNAVFTPPLGPSPATYLPATGVTINGRGS